MKTMILALVLIIAGTILTLFRANEKVSDITKAHKIEADSLKAVTAKYEKLTKEYKTLDSTYSEQISFTNQVIGQLNKALSPVKVAIDKNLKEDWKALPDSDKIESCDSLREYVKEYRTEQEHLDSLKDLQIETFAKQNYERQLQIENCAYAYEEVATYANIAIRSNNACVDELVLTEKKLKKQKFWNKVLIGVGIIAGGFAASHAIK